MKKNRLSKMKRKVSSRRKKLTNNEKLQNRWKSELHNKNGSVHDNPLLREKFRKLVKSKLENLRKQVEEKGIDPDTLEPINKEEHLHSEECNHNHV